MTVVDDETSRLWQLLTELSAQLSANKEHCDNLKRQCEQLKTQAIHTGTGFTLRRFNTDITKEQFESELERFNATLVLENQALQYENRQLSMLLKDYEGTLDNVMAKFRSFAHSSQQYELESARHYETLLMQHVGEPLSSDPIASTSSLNNNNASKALVSHNLTQNGALHPLHHHHQAVQGARPAILDLQDPLALQWSLAHLSSLIRKALRSIQGEDDVSSSSSDDDSSSSDGGDDAVHDNATSSKDARAQLQSLSSVVSHTAAALEKQQQSTTSPSSSALTSQSTHPSSSQAQQSSQHHHHPHADTKHDEGEGGYVRLLLNHGFDKSTAALERDIELERLRKENETLREMLAVANEVPIPPTATAATAATS